MKIIKDQVYKVIKHSQGFDPHSLDLLIGDWYTNKSFYITAFGGTPIYEGPEVSFTLGVDEKATIFSRLISWIESNYDLPDLLEFLRLNKTGFFDNVVVEPYKGVPKGMKLLRAFKQFIPGKSALRDIQDKASQDIQKNKVSGILCLSVHPLDFLSSSENNHNWRSCHALDGEFRAGNLSYMLDRSTVVCYIRSKKNNVRLDRFPDDVPWNSKKWRMLLHFSDNYDMVFASKQYPFKLPGVLHYVDEMLSQTAHLSKCMAGPVAKSWGLNSWRTECIDDPDLWSKYIKIDGYLMPLENLITEPQPILQYNDILRSSSYSPVYAISHDINMPDKEPHFTIGAPVLCPKCGVSLVRDSDMMMCYHCYAEMEEESAYGTCEFCGGVIWTEDDAHELQTGSVICSHCFENYAYICPRCGDAIADDMKIYHQGTDEYYCEDCFEEVCFSKKEE